MFTRAVRVARIRGVEVRLDPSLVLVVVLVGWVLWVRFAADNPSVVAVVMAAAGTVLFFASLLAHELAHAFEALHRGLPVHQITLFLFGGVTEMDAAAESPRDEFVVAAVGPYVSLVCGAVFGLVATFAPLALGVAGGPVAEVAGLLGWLNVLLAVFNLVPGAPLDGGRVLRAALWWITGDRHKALRVAARAGQLLGLLLVAYGLAGLVRSGIAVAIGAFWWVLIGGFLWLAARNELRQSELDAVLGEVTIGELVGAPATVLAAGQRLDAPDLPAPAGDLVAVVDADRMVGVIPSHELARLDPADRAMRLAGDLAVGVEDRPTVGAHEDLHAVVAAFRTGTDVIRVAHPDGTVAVVSERDVARALGRWRRDRAGGRRRWRPGRRPVDPVPGGPEPVGSDPASPQPANPDPASPDPANPAPDEAAR